MLRSHGSSQQHAAGASIAILKNQNQLKILACTYVLMHVLWIRQVLCLSAYVFTQPCISSVDLRLLAGSDRRLKQRKTCPKLPGRRGRKGEGVAAAAPVFWSGRPEAESWPARRLTQSYLVLICLVRTTPSACDVTAISKVSFFVFF